MGAGHIFLAGRLDRICQQRVFRGVRAMTAHNGADESLAEAKHLFKGVKESWRRRRRERDCECWPTFLGWKNRRSDSRKRRRLVLLGPIIVWGDAHMCMHKGRQLRRPWNKTWSCPSSLPPRSGPETDQYAFPAKHSPRLHSAAQKKDNLWIRTLFWVHFRTSNTK